MQFIDTLPCAAMRRTQDGYLVATPRVARTGIQFYSGREIDPDNLHGLRDKENIAVYRPPEEVFSPAALASYAHRPVTNNHPPEMVDSQNWKQYVIGQTGDEITRDGETVRVPLVLMDEAAISDVLAGKRELSMGYSAELVFADGTTPEGETFKAKQTNLRMNHLAVVAAARGGSSLTLGDEKTSLKHERKRLMKKVKLTDGLLVEVSEEDAVKLKAAIELMQKQILEAEARAETARVEATALQAQVEELSQEAARRDVAAEEHEQNTEESEAFDTRVAARAELIARARLVDARVKTFGLADHEIRHAVVAAKLGATAIHNKPQSYIDARFDILAEDALKTAESALALRAGLVRPASLADAATAEKQAHAAMVARFNR